MTYELKGRCGNRNFVLVQICFSLLRYKKFIRFHVTDMWSFPSDFPIKVLGILVALILTTVHARRGLLYFFLPRSKDVPENHVLKNLIVVYCTVFARSVLNARGRLVVPSCPEI
jgi:hypothetical protein